MPLGAAAIISIAIASALASGLIAAAVYQLFFNKEPRQNGTNQPMSWNPTQYSDAQLEHMRELRYLAKMQMWEVAKQFRGENGMFIPDWYHRDRSSASSKPWIPFSASASVMSGARMEREALEAAEQDIVDQRMSIGPAYRNSHYHNSSIRHVDDADDANAEEDDGQWQRVSVAKVTPATYLDQKRWTQHGAPRWSQYGPECIEMTDNPRITVNDRPWSPDDITSDEYHHHQKPWMPNRNQMLRSSSMYSGDVLNLLASVPPAAHHLSQERLLLPTDGVENLEQSRVRQMVKQWESVN